MSVSAPVVIAAQNFREIGPASTRDGRRLKPGLLFRSGDLSEVTDACVVEMQRLGIQSVVDLRSVEERQAHPYEWLPAVDTAAWGDRAGQSAASVSRLLRRPDVSVEDVTEAMRMLYRELPFSHAESFRTLFLRIAEGRLPLLFGCAAGKDRTGVGAALLLWSVGIRLDDIADDYLRTNDSFEMLQALATRKFGWRAGTPTVDLALRAERTFLDAALEAVAERCRGIDDYVTEILGLSADERAAIERNLLS